MQRQLPTSAQPPVVSKSNPDDQPIMTIGLSGPFSRQLLADIARYQVEDMLETIPGVGQITTMGYLDRNIRIWIDADKLVATGVTVTDVMTAIQQAARQRPRRRARQRRAASSTCASSARRRTSTTLRSIVVRSSGGATVRVQDVALVEDGFDDITTLRALERRARPGDGHPEAARLERRRRRQGRVARRSPTCRRRSRRG